MSYDNTLIARGLKVYVGIDAHDDMVPDLLAGRVTIQQVLSLLDGGGVGVWWGIMGQFGDIEDFEDYAYSDDMLADTYEDLEGGDVSIVLIGKRPTRNGEPWDPEWHNPPEAGGLMGNSYLDPGEPVELVEVRYNAGKGWKSLPARGLRTKAQMEVTSAIVQHQQGTPLNYGGKFPGRPERLYLTEPGYEGRHTTGNWEGTPNDVVAYLDYSVVGQQVYIWFMTTREDREGQGLAGRLVADLYRRTTGEVEWGELMDAGAEVLYKRFLKSHSERTGGGKVWGQWLTGPPPPSPEMQEMLRKIRGEASRGDVDIEVKPSGPLQLGDWTVVARINGEIVGRLSGGKYNAVEKVFVAPEHRRKGIATKMFRALLEREPSMRMPDEFTDSGAAWFSKINPEGREYSSTWGTDPNWSAWMRQAYKIAARKMTWDQVKAQYPVYSAWGMDHAVNELAHILDGEMVTPDLVYTEEMVDLREVRFQRYPETDQRMKSLLEAYNAGRPVPPPLLVKRAGELHTVDGHHRLSAREARGETLVPAVIAHSLRKERYSGAASIGHTSRNASKTALPSWRDRGVMPERAEAIIAPDLGRGRRNSYMVYLYGQPHARRVSLAEAKATVEDIYGDLEWEKVPGDQMPHHDPVHGWTTMFNDADYYYVVRRLPRLGATGSSGARGDLPEGLVLKVFDQQFRGKFNHKRGVQAILDGKVIGNLLWFTDESSGMGGHRKGEIVTAWVDEAYRRQGIASAMLAKGREADPWVHHSDALSPDAEAWSQHVASATGSSGQVQGNSRTARMHRTAVDDDYANESEWFYSLGPNHDLTKKRRLSTLEDLAYQVAQDYRLNASAIEVVQGLYGRPSTAEYDWSTGVGTITIAADMQDRWTLLHEMVHLYFLTEGSDEIALYHDHHFDRLFTEFLKRYGKVDVRFGSSPPTRIRLASRGLWWRSHPKEREFGPDDASSRPWGRTDDEQPGYSAMSGPWELWGYWADHANVLRKDEVIAFSGTRVGSIGFEGLIEPDMQTVHRMSWEEFEQMLTQTPIPARVDLNTSAPDWQTLARRMLQTHPRSVAAEYLLGKMRSKRAVAADLDHWRPTKGMFARGQDTLDPRVFDTQTEHMLPAVHDAVLDALDAYWTPKYGDWRAWAKVYLAGSGASYWWDSDADMDILIGVDLDRLREARPANKEVADEEIVAHLNRGLKEDLRPTTTEFLGLFEATWFINAGAYDITAIHPYAAYDITADVWVVKPPVLPANWGPSSIPESTWRRCEMAAREAEQVLSLPEPERSIAGTIYFDWVHEGRRAAYSAYGGGWLDPGNVIYQYLSLHPERLLRRLYLAKHPEQATEADAIEVTAAGTTTVYRGLYVKLEEEDLSGLPGSLVERVRRGGVDHTYGSSRQNLGVHWTTDKRVAQRFATPMTRYGEKPSLGSNDWEVFVPVVLTGRVSSADVVTSEEELRDAMVEGYGWNGLPSTTRLPEQEVLVRPGAHIDISDIEAVSPAQWWRVRQAIENFEAGRVRDFKADWKRIGGGIRATAALPALSLGHGYAAEDRAAVPSGTAGRGHVGGDHRGRGHHHRRDRRRAEGQGVRPRGLDAPLRVEAAKPTRYVGPLARSIGRYSVRTQQEIASALLAMKRGRLRPDPKQGSLKGFYTIPFGGTVTSTPQRLFLMRDGEEWVAAYARFDHDYRRAEEDLAAWIASLRRGRQAKVAGARKEKYGPNMHLGASGGSIYRGLRVPFTPEIEHLLRNYEEREELAERRSAKVAKIILDHMERHRGKHSTGLGIHWSTRPEMAGVAAETTGEFRDWRVIIEATYQPGDVVPEGDDLYDLSGVWVGNKIEAEVLIKPGARLRVTGLWVGDNVDTNVLSADRTPKMNVRGSNYCNILPVPEVRTAGSHPITQPVNSCQ